MIRVDSAWLATEPLDMRAGMDTALARVIAVFGAAEPHHAYVFANRRATRVKVLVHDGIGLVVGGAPPAPGQVRLGCAWGLDMATSV